MNKIYIKTLTILISVLCLFSCKDWLDVKPEDGLTRQDYWKTKEQVEAAVVGCYSSMLDESFVMSLFHWGELRADLVTCYSAPNNNWLFSKNLITEDNSLCDWTSVYKTINYCNTVLHFARDVLSEDRTFTESALKAYEAEALGIRALLYFYLARTFGDVPLKLDATYSDDQNFLIRKTSQDTIFRQIMADLTTAEANIPLTYGDVAKDKGRITKYTIWAIQADVYLWLNMNNECIEACDKIINSGKFGLINSVNPESWLYEIFVRGNSNEGIFELQFSDQKLNPFYLNFVTRNYYRASTVISSQLFLPDENNPDEYDYRSKGASYNVIDMSMWKYLGMSSVTARTQETSYAHWIFYRYAEILLMKAEALAQVSRGQEAIDIIQRIRDRGHALASTEINVSADNASGLSRYILEERGRELAFEGKRWYDMLRIAKRNNYAMLDILIDTEVRKISGDLISTMINNLKDTRSHYLPIYKAELDKNKLLVQNPFYVQ
jgi:starch-binding outer membrane protein, SusD/RagB family